MVTSTHWVFGLVTQDTGNGCYTCGGSDAWLGPTELTTSRCWMAISSDCRTGLVRRQSLEQGEVDKASRLLERMTELAPDWVGVECWRKD